MPLVKTKTSIQLLLIQKEISNLAKQANNKLGLNQLYVTSVRCPSLLTKPINMEIR